MSPEPYRDRSVGLIVFGVIELLIGGLTALLIPLVLAVALLAPAGGMDLRSAAPSLVLYALVAATFIWIGIGSIRARKWARSIMLSLSWLWLISGVVAMVVLWWLLPGSLDAAGMTGLPDDTVGLVMLTTSLFVGFIYILLPLAFVLFYRSPDVIATCEARDRSQSWPDECPTVVVSMVVLYAVTAASCLVAPAYRFAFPVFGLVVDGWWGALAWAVVLAVLIYLVVGTARRTRRSWKVAMAASIVLAGSSTVTAAVVPFGEWLDRMALPADQRQLMAAFGEPTTATMVVASLITWASWIAFLLWARRYVRGDAGL